MGERCHPARIGQTRWERVRELALAEAWLSAEEISSHLGITKDTVYLWIAEKGLPAHRVGRLWKFQTSEVDEWVRSGRAGDDGGAA